jgi:MFS family permease
LRQFPAVPLAALGLLTIVAYGACYYAYGVLIQPISVATGWSAAALGAGFSIVLVVTGAGGIFAGRVLDRRGEQLVFALGALVGSAAMLLGSFQTSLVPFLAAYAGGCGLVGALGYYHVTQALAARSHPAAPARAIVWLTILGAFSSPIYLPFTAELIGSVGWRNTIRIEAATVAVAFALAAVLLRGRSAAPNLTVIEPARRALRAAWGNKPIRVWVLATVVGAAAIDVLLVYQVSVMVSEGLALTTAATIAGLRGLGQLIGRIPLGFVIRRLGVRQTVVAAYCAAALAALLLYGSGNLATAALYALFAGASIGALSALQGIYTHELVDERHLGMLLGTQQAFFGAGGAVGPAVAGAVLASTGSYTPTIAITAAGLAFSACALTFGGVALRSDKAIVTVLGSNE